MNISTKFIPNMASKEKIFEYSFANLLWQPTNQIYSGLDKIHMVGTRLLKEHFCKTFVKISEVR